ncbi:SelT-like protein [Scenedesmus sp. PABB004]|nr:SelT-like protein [Scenedesmus sp. PABB004]
MQVKQLLEQRYPGMQVVGSVFPVPRVKAGAAQVVGAAQMAAFVGIAAGERLFEALGRAAPPAWYAAHVAPNKLGVGVGVWFAGNVVQNALLSTGAFEVYFDGSLVFSKLAVDRMPGGDELLAAIDAARTARLPDDDDAPLDAQSEVARERAREQQAREQLRQEAAAAAAA